MVAARFRHLGEIERKRIVTPANMQMRLNRLEKPEPWPEDLQAEIMLTFKVDALQQYPSYPEFYERLATFIGVEPQEIVVGAGIEEHIRNLFMLCIEPGDTVAFLWPTCAMFEVYARIFGAKVARITCDVGEGIHEIVRGLPDDVKLFILANPGQPQETCFGFGALRVLAEAMRSRGGILAIDEAYHGFGAPTAVGCHDWYDNLVVLRTFSKAFGAASIRLGYAVGAPAIIAALNAVRQSGEVSAFSMHVASVLMEHYKSHVEPSIEAICGARDTLRNRVNTELGFKASGYFANHVLIDFKDVSLKEQITGRLADQGIYVKADYPEPLASHMLVTCGGPVLMDRFFEALKAAL